MPEIIQYALLPGLGLTVLVFGFAPPFLLRIILLMYPPSDPRRAELMGELRARPWRERPIWLAEQLETAVFEGLPLRFRERQRRRQVELHNESRNQRMTLAKARIQASTLSIAIDLDEQRGSLRHRTVRPVTLVSSLLPTVVAHFPIMLWLASSVFNVDWNHSFGLPLAISLFISLLATVGTVLTLLHLGSNLRENKNHARRPDWSSVSIGAWVSIVGIGVLTTLVAVVMFMRLYTEGLLSGLPQLALVLATLVVIVMVLSSILVLVTAFCNGSPERDALAYYTRWLEQEDLRNRHGGCTG